MTIRSRLRQLPISVGIVPEKLVRRTQNSFRLVNSPTVLGMVPTKLSPSQLKSSVVKRKRTCEHGRTENVFSDTVGRTDGIYAPIIRCWLRSGNVPLMFEPATDNILMSVLAVSSGKGPENWTNARLNTSNFHSPREAGIVPASCVPSNTVGEKRMESLEPLYYDRQRHIYCRTSSTKTYPSFRAWASSRRSCRRSRLAPDCPLAPAW